jgi:molybdopterin-guanine dinucleotide biosynthesis protein A
MIELRDISAIILAGGRGTRMGGVDKGLQNFHGKPLALHAASRLKIQQGGPLGAVMFNANRNLADYAAFGLPVWPDGLADYAGPLAGFQIGLQHCETDYLLTLPCDTPLFPLDLAQRLALALEREDAEIAMVAAPEEDGQLRAQPVFCLLQRELLESLVRFTANGGRKVDQWTARHKTVLVHFGAPGDDSQAFFNANTLEELQSLQRP